MNIKVTAFTVSEKSINIITGKQLNQITLYCDETKKLAFNVELKKTPS